MNVYRISTAKFADKKTASGLPNRWNKKGQSVLYTSQNSSLAILETLVHNPSMASLKYSVVTIEIDDDSIHDIADENYDPIAFTNNSRKIGAALFEQKQVKILKVPSVVNWMESNFIINVAYPQTFEIIHIQPWEYDDRLIRQMSKSLH